ASSRTRARALARSTPPPTRGRRPSRARTAGRRVALAGALLERPQRDAADDLLAVARDEDRVVAAGQRGELSLGVDEPAVRPEPAEVLPEELAKRVGVGHARAGDQRSA